MPAKPISRPAFKLTAAGHARLKTAYDALFSANGTQSAARRKLAVLEQDQAGIQSKIAAIESRRNHRSLADGQQLAGLQAQLVFVQEKIAETQAAVPAQAAANVNALTNTKSAIQFAIQPELEALIHRTALALLPIYGEWPAALETARLSPLVRAFGQHYIGHLDSAAPALELLAGLLAGRNDFVFRVAAAPKKS